LGFCPLDLAGFDFKRATLKAFDFTALAFLPTDLAGLDFKVLDFRAFAMLKIPSPGFPPDHE